jgi:hypothetical protein
MSRTKVAKTGNTPTAHNSLFLSNLLRDVTFWREMAAELRKGGQDFEHALEYAEAYQILLHNFSEVEKPTEPDNS